MSATGKKYTTISIGSDAFDLVAQFKNIYIDNKPSADTIRDELRMSSMQVKTHVGDIFTVDVNNAQLLEAVWLLTKLESYVTTVHPLIPRREQKVFYDMMGQYQKEFESRLQAADIRLPFAKIIAANTNAPLAVEIFRGKKNKKRLH